MEGKKINPAAQAFGQVARPERSGDHQPKELELQAPLKFGGVMHCFCQGCGELFEIEVEGAKTLAVNAGVDLPAKLNDHYFLVQSCEVCDEKGSYTHAELHEVPK